MRSLLLFALALSGCSQPVDESSVEGDYQFLKFGNDAELALIFNKKTGCVAQLEMPYFDESGMSEENRMPPGTFLIISFSDWTCPNKSGQMPKEVG